MSRLLFWMLAGLGGDAMIVLGAMAKSWPEVAVGLVIALGSLVMLSTGWWMGWERTTHDFVYTVPEGVAAIRVDAFGAGGGGGSGDVWLVEPLWDDHRRGHEHAAMLMTWELSNALEMSHFDPAPPRRIRFFQPRRR